MGSHLVQIACNTSADVCEAVLASSSDNITRKDLQQCVKVTDSDQKWPFRRCFGLNSTSRRRYVVILGLDCVSHLCGCI